MLEEAWHSPRVLPTSARLRACLVGPVRTTPGAAWRAEDAHVVFPSLDTPQELVLLGLVEQIVSRAAHEDVDLCELQADAGV